MTVHVKVPRAKLDWAVAMALQPSLGVDVAVQVIHEHGCPGVVDTDLCSCAEVELKIDAVDHDGGV